MKPLLNCIYIVCCGSLLAACISQTINGPVVVSDLAAGYRKTATAVDDLRGAQIIQNQFSGRVGSEKLSTPALARPTSDGRQRSSALLPKTEMFQPGQKLSLVHTMKTRFFSEEGVPSSSKITQVTITKQASLVPQSGAPSCVHVGDKFALNFKFVPPPISEDQRALIPHPVLSNSCLGVVSNRYSSGIRMLLEAKCVGQVDVHTEIRARPLIVQPSPQSIRVVTALQEPRDLTVAFGDYDPGGDDQDLANRTSLEKERFVTFTWKASADAIGTKIQVFRVGKQVPVEGATIVSKGSYKTSLITGKTYHVQIQSRLPGCAADGDLSRMVKSSTFRVPL